MVRSSLTPDEKVVEVGGAPQHAEQWLHLTALHEQMEQFHRVHQKKRTCLGEADVAFKEAKGSSKDQLRSPRSVALDFGNPSENGQWRVRTHRWFGRRALSTSHWMNAFAWGWIATCGYKSHPRTSSDDTVNFFLLLFPDYAQKNDHLKRGRLVASPGSITFLEERP